MTGSHYLELDRHRKWPLQAKQMAQDICSEVYTLHGFRNSGSLLGPSHSLLLRTAQSGVGAPAGPILHHSPPTLCSSGSWRARNSSYSALQPQCLAQYLAEHIFDEGTNV